LLGRLDITPMPRLLGDGDNQLTSCPREQSRTIGR
jgi:hypothetical protein